MLTWANEDGNAAIAATAAIDFLLKSMANEMLCMKDITEIEDLLKIVGKILKKIP